MTSIYFAKHRLLIGLAFVCLTNASCDKYLSEKPTRGSTVTIQTTADLDALLNNYGNFYAEPDNVAIYGTDDNGFNASLYDAQPYGFSAGIVQFSLWDVPNLPQTDQSNYMGPNFWSNEYLKIFRANVVLANLGTVSGTEVDKAILKADAHFIRAYSYWQLANTYCLPYTDASQNEPGIPIKTTPDYDIVPRGTLAATYQQIEADLKEALATTVPLVQKGVARHWRTNISAVNGFAARYYLNRNDYANALTYANTALTSYSTLVDYNTEMRYGIPASVNVNGQDITINFPYTHDNPTTYDPTNALKWKELLYYRLLTNNDNWYIPSPQLISLYDTTNDLRFKYHIVPNFSYSRGLLFPAFEYPGYVFFSNDGIPEGPTTAEMLLIKAECLARTGDMSGAMTAVNQLHRKRTKAGSPDLTAATQDQAIAVVLQERRRELPFTQRWFDIRRFNSNNYAADDVTLTKTFYPYTANGVTSGQAPINYSLPKGSRRFASPLPLSDINSSTGLIQQNTY